MTQPTIGDLVAKHNELKAYIEAEDEAYKERMKPYKDGINAILATCGVILQAQAGPDGKSNFSSDAGTAYLQHGLSVKVDNRADFLNFVREVDGWDYVDLGVLKDPVRAYLDKHNAPPPGIKTEAFVKCLIRRT